MNFKKNQKTFEKKKEPKYPYLINVVLLHGHIDQITWLEENLTKEFFCRNHQRSFVLILRKESTMYLKMIGCDTIGIIDVIGDAARFHSISESKKGISIKKKRDFENVQKRAYLMYLPMNNVRCNPSTAA